jgi:hypothetical protein
LTVAVVELPAEGFIIGVSIPYPGFSSWISYLAEAWLRGESVESGDHRPTSRALVINIEFVY